MAQKKVNDYGTGASEVKASVNRAVARAKKAVEKKEIAEKRAAKKQADALKKIEDKKNAKSAGQKKSGKKTTNVVLQYGGTSVSYRTVVARAREIWKKEHRGSAADLLSLDIYLKPEECKAYYVFNGEIAGDFWL
ncbi:MAG: DUF6465 family protein [Lachnospiraceae bacterium]|nr:DUF6465 family protein [Lachnospiraceae bacterium]